MGQQGLAAAGNAMRFDPRLDERQLFTGEQLGGLFADGPNLVAVRYETVVEGGAAVPYVDLIFHARVSDKLVIALGLPIREGLVVWPQVFAVWPSAFLWEASQHATRQLAGQAPPSGHLFALPGFREALRFDPEVVRDGRSCPGLENYWTIAQLLWRYRFVKSQIAQGRILEVACGPGYGAGMLLKEAPTVDAYVGMDLDADAVELARRSNVDARAQFRCGDLAELDAEAFDWVLSLETVEHTPDPERFLEQLKRHMKPDGRMIVSLPCERWHGFHLNRNHWSAWNLDRIRAFIEPHFEEIEYFTYDRPTFTEHAFDIAQVRPLDWHEDRSRHEGYFMLLRGPRQVKPRPRLVVKRRYARGDALQATPIVHALRRRHPDHTLVVSTDVNEVFSNNPDVDLLMATSSGFRPRPEDRVIDLDGAYERRPSRHILDAYVEAAGATPDDPRLRLHPNRWDYEAARALIAPKLETWSGIEYLVAVHLCTTPDRSWPAAHWIKFLEALRQRPEIGVIVVGAGNDLAVTEHERLINAVNRCDLLTTAACIALADCLIAPDSSLLHVAAAVGTPAIGLYGMASPERRIPYAAMQSAIVAPVDCAGCLHELPPPVTNPRCKFGKSFCMEAIAPDEVLGRFEDVRALTRSRGWRRRLELLAGAKARASVRSEPEPSATVSAPPGGVPETNAAAALRRFSARPDGRTPSLTVVIRSGEQRADEPPTRALLEAQWVVPRRVETVAGDSLHALNAVVNRSETDWVLFLRTGDVCAPELVANLMNAAERHPEWGLIYLDEAQIGADDAMTNPHFKPDFSLDYLRSMPYTGNAFAVRRSVFEALGGFDARYEGIEEYDFLLRFYEQAGREGIGHLSGALVLHKPGVSLSQRPLAEVLESGRQALAAHLVRLGVAADVEQGPLPATYRVRYRHAAKPLVSIVIPTRNQREMLERCLESLFAHTAWPNYEILVVDNGSDEADAVHYLDGLRALGAELGGRLRVLDYPQAFNYSAMNNLAADEARGEYLLLLNNDTAALHDDWLDAMMEHAQRPEVGVVGAKLLYPDGKVQHAGVVLGMQGPAEHPFIRREAKDPGYYARLQVVQNYSSVTGACLLVRKALFDEVGGLDADELAVSYSDIDLCLKISARGKSVVWTPYAILMHEGSKSQKAGVETADDAARSERFAREKAVMYRRWMPQIANDPAYNRCLSLGTTEFVAEPDPALCWDPDWRPAPRIIAQPADRMGCGEYRIIAPTRALVNAGRIQGQETDRIYTPPELARLRPDALILQRQVEPHQIEAIERHKRFNDVFCVFEIDDLVTNVPVKNAHKKHLPKDLYKRLRRAAAACDRLVVATEPLAEAYRGLAADVRVVPNFVEAARWDALKTVRRAGRKPRVGWAGGVSHTGDLELIDGVVEALKDEVEWVFFGMCPERLRPYVHEFHPPVPIDRYAPQLASLNLDLAVAPLEDVPFNHAKSHLRLLEYGILGYPVVCSDITPYRGDFPVTRVRNRFRDWVEAIRAHLADLDATAQQGDALRRHVRERWLLEENLDAWLQGWLPADFG